MRTTRQPRGFTLVELMIVVAIVGVLAALAIYGVSAYLSSSKAAEAKNNTGAITRAAVAAYQRVGAPNQLLGAGSAASGASQELCESATYVPGGMSTPKGKKYQPKTKDGDFDSHSSTKGWRCLKFSISQPIIYKLGYLKNNQFPGSGDMFSSAAGANDYFVAGAMGDTDGDGVLAQFIRGGVVRDGQVVTSTEITVWNESE